MKLTPLARRTKLDSLILCSEGLKQVTAAKILGIGDRTIRKVKRKQRLYGDIEGGVQKRGPKPKLTEELIQVHSLPPHHYLTDYRFLLV
jgi:transposase